MQGEGKSTTSANFAFFLAEAGFRTLLVDGDLRRRTLSKALSPECLGGFAEVAAGSMTLQQVSWHDEGSNLRFLPASADRSGIDLLSLASPHAQALLARLKNEFDFVVIDLPAILPVADAAAAANILDGVVMVVEWTRTPVAIVRESIEQSAIDPARLLGIVLNKVELKALPRYDVTAQVYNPPALTSA